jgi:hypothetical protein
MATDAACALDVVTLSSRPVSERPEQRIAGVLHVRHPETGWDGKVSSKSAMEGSIPVDSRINLATGRFQNQLGRAVASFDLFRLQYISSVSGMISAMVDHAHLIHSERGGNQALYFSLGHPQPPPHPSPAPL